ncbi:MAG: glycosyltransferase family 39 protein [Terracidiphilus sp.]|jgi:4-amino-4-deoxy-L-arabinose transferase-like glycosyltransferase
MTNQTNTFTRPQSAPSTRVVWLLFAAIFTTVYFASLFTPPLMDDVDSTHAQAAQYFAEHSDWISAKINGIRYIEKPPLPYWTVAVLFHVFGQNVFSAHLPNTLAMLGLTWIAWLWARRGWGPRAGLYAGLGVLTSIGPFLFTRFIIPEAQLSLFLLIALYCQLTGFEPGRGSRFYWMWALPSVALMTKGLIAPTFFFGAAIPFLLVTGLWRRWREMKPVLGPLIFLAISAPWHILCGLANPDQGHAVGNHPTFGNVHGFFYFYFINEHYLRFFGLRYPHDYNKLPGLAYWLLHLVWIFPWSLFIPAVVAVAWTTRRHWMQYLRSGDGLPAESSAEADGLVFNLRFRTRSIWLLSLFSAWTLLFFSISTNQEYYTFPVWPPLVILIAAVVAGIEEKRIPAGAPAGSKPLLSTAWLTGAQGVFAVIGLLSAAVLGWGLWESRHLPFVDDVGTLLAHRAVGDYTLSMSHLFDLTFSAFAALRLPAVMAAIVLLIGPVLGWLLRLKGRHLAATISVALTMSVFLIAAHIAFARFDPMLGSKRMADTLLAKASPADSIIIYGEQSEGSSIIFYTHYFFGKPAMFVYPRCGQHGEGTPLLWGSCYPDAPDIFLSTEKLSSIWGTGERKWLFAQDPNQLKAEQVLGDRLILVQTVADKALWTDRPLK